MKNTIGIGFGEAAEAVEMATADIIDPSFVLFYTTYEKLADVAKLIKEKYPEAQTMGVIGAHYGINNTDVESLLVLALYDDVRVKANIIKEVSKAPLLSIKQIKDDVRSCKPRKEKTVVLEYTTGNEEILISTFTAALAEFGIQLAGGSIYGAPDGCNNIAAFDGEIYEDCCVYVVIKNRFGRVNVYKENIYCTVDRPSHYANETDFNEKILYEMDGRKFVDVYCEETGVSVDQIVTNTFSSPLGRIVGDEVFITSLKEVAEDGSVSTFKRINKNDCLDILELGDYDAIGKETRAKMVADVEQISLLMSIDCLFRYMLYTDKGYNPSYVEQMSELAPYMALVCGGEQFNNQHVNQTMIGVVFE